MGEFINRRELICDTEDRYTLGEIGRTERDIIVDALVHAKAVDVRPAVKGRWEECIVDDKDDPVGMFRRRFYCSSCGDWQTYGRAHYCPSCGAEMEGD